MQLTRPKHSLGAGFSLNWALEERQDMHHCTVELGAKEDRCLLKCKRIIWKRLAAYIQRSRGFHRTSYLNLYRVESLQRYKPAIIASRRKLRGETGICDCLSYPQTLRYFTEGLPLHPPSQGFSKKKPIGSEGTRLPSQFGVVDPQI
jgi:hypothetical protein